MTRKLASVRQIKEISPIEGADNIEKIILDGWTCVSKKGEFKQNQLCVYFEIDSFLPILPEFEFLRKTSYRKMCDIEGFRLKTIRLKGILSQGLALPLTILKGNKKYNAGEDVTEELGILKFEPPIPAELQGVAKGLFPSFISKTDQERVQNIWEKIQHITDSFEISVKLDGSSGTYYYHNGAFGVCSRNFEIIESDTNTLWKIARKYDIEGLLRSFGKNIALQGEIIGEGIQKNPEKLKGQDFYLFDIWCIDKHRYYSPKDRCDVHRNFFQKLQHVPILSTQSHLYSFSSVEDLLSAAEGPSLNNSVREGIVFRSNNSNLTFKAISNTYLLNEKENI